MRSSLILMFVLISGLMYGQYGDKAVGIRIGNTSSGKYFNPTVNSSFSSSTVEITAEGEKISAYEIYDMNEELIAIQEVSSSSSTTFNSDGLEPGMYYVVVVSETEQLRLDVFYKEEEL